MRNFQARSAAIRIAKLLVGTACLSIAIAAPAVAQKRSFNLPSQNGSIAIPEFARQAGIQISAPTTQLKPIRTHAVNGVLDVRDALKLLLRGTGLVIASDNGGMIVLRKEQAPSDTTSLLNPSDRTQKSQNIQTAAYQPSQNGQSSDVYSPAPASQPQLAVDDQEKPAVPSEIVVTGTRIVRDGFSAPTPVTVARTDDLIRAAPTNLPEAINQLPQFNNSSGGARGNQTVIGSPTHGNFLNLRGVGPIRTLILMDGVRVPPTTYTGTVNVDVIPQQFIQRVEVVTAGASAAYGSDAVAGVVNFVLDTKFTGLKAIAQSGISSRGDYFNYRLGLAGGFEISDRAHLLVSVERNKIDGLSQGSRKNGRMQWVAAGSLTGSGAAGTATRPYEFYSDSRFGIATPGGWALTGPFANTNFISPGVYRPLNPGAPTGTGTLRVGGDFFAFSDTTSLSPDQEIDQAFARFSYDFDHDISAYVQGTYAVPRVRYFSVNIPMLGRTIYSGNAFLPPELQARLDQINPATGAPYTGFLFSRVFNEWGSLPGYEKTQSYNLAAGIKGKLGDFGWNIDYTHGNSVHRVNAANQFNLRNAAAAVDAVRDPLSGNIVCRVALTNPGLYPGCVPLDVFGVGAPSEAARAYVTGDSRYRAENSSDAISGSIQGNLFSTWAGPVAVALGAEYRRQKLQLTSNADPSVSRPITGLRGGIVATDPLFHFTNIGEALGKLNVKELFGEIAVPLAKDLPFAQYFELNAAGRYTDYSTSGSVKTWKVGGIWRPIEDLTVRITRSRDIRAPTLFDLFAGRTFTLAAPFDPVVNANVAANLVGGGNPDLKPEIGNTLSAGVVIQPRFAPGFSLSADFFDLKVSGAIANLSFTQIINDCFNSGGSAPSCAFITRASPTSPLSEVRALTANISGIKTRGVDVEASYRTTLGTGNLTIRALLSYLDRYRTQQSLSQPVYEQAGWGTSFSGLSKVKGNLTINYDSGPFGIFVQERMIGKIRLGTNSVTPGGAEEVYAEGPVKAQFYTDVTLTARVPGSAGEPEIFLTINNLFDNDPPLVPNSTVAGNTFPSITSVYDAIGRTFTVGARFKF